MKYFVSGHRDLSYEDFEKYYIPVMDEVIGTDTNAEFVVGDCDGVDKFAMDYIYQHYKGYCSLVICHMFTSPRNTPMNRKVNEFDNYMDGTEVHFVGGFESDEERDSAMTKASDFDIAFIKDNRWDSGTAHNIKRRHNI